MNSNTKQPNETQSKPKNMIIGGKTTVLALNRLDGGSIKVLLCLKRAGTARKRRSEEAGIAAACS